ncbi:hypothetical protein DEU56DRAFT_733681, partial [Suillus clintonianus]|uniref:uncharacterized protein n=1 Tax=Suillus clintonianus TaxID=1904413 RepID=UPI001B86E83E
MNRLHADPHLDQCPDFASVEFLAVRAPLLSPAIDNTQAAALLQTFWVATNAALKLQWHQQLAADELIAAERRRLLLEEDAQRLLAQQIEDAAVAAEEKKKNRIHHIPIPDRPRPQRNAAESVLVSDFALRKLDKAQFVELYYWTNRGLAAARLDYRTLDDDSLVPTAGADGSTTWTSASASRPAAGVIADHLLSPLDFSRAVPRFIASLQERGWINSRVVMLANFFGALMVHPYWSSDDVFEQRAILTYQEEQRRAWHQAI